MTAELGTPHEPTARALRPSARWALGPLRPFHTGQYRLLVTSVALTLAAFGVWVVALVWQVIALGGGPAQMSGVATASAAGMVGTTLIGGVMSDRIPQRRILLGVATVRAVALSVIAFLALTGMLDLWHLVLMALIVGGGDGIVYPAYSALLPSIVPTDDLMAANAVEGIFRPVLLQAAGPLLASIVVASWSPAAGIAAVAVLETGAAACIFMLRPTPLRRDLTVVTPRHPVRAVLSDLAEGFGYLLRTPWLRATLVFTSTLVLLVIGPVEVLIPFAVKDRAGGGPPEHALVVAGFGIGGAVGSLLMATRRMPRRYLTFMLLCWGAGTAPMAMIGFATDLEVMVAAMFVVGFCFSAPMVIWGTLLQRRVPPELLGRISSLDFFVSVAFMPVSMALAGAVASTIGLRATFLVAGLAPALAAMLVLTCAGLPADEIAHPLDHPESTPVD